jgi:hypothetical protein
MPVTKKGTKRAGGKKAGGKKAAAKKSAGKAATGSAAGGEQKHKGQVLKGKSPKGVTFDSNQIMAAPSGPDNALEFDRPRPSPTRYPVDMETFLALKEGVKESKIKPAKRGTTIVLDTGKRQPPRSARRGGGIEIAGTPLADAPVAAAPTSLTTFPGISATGWLPPDCTFAAGPSHVLASVNATVAIYAKTGGAPLKQITLTSWFSNVISGAKIFDPKALYDQHAGRWVLLAVALGPGSTESFFLLSVSKTIDPLGGWFNYKMDAKKDGATPTTNWADYPGLGVDAQALYLTANMFSFGGSFQYSKIRVVPKAGPYSGGAAPFFDFVKMKNGDGSMAFTIQPCHTYGSPGGEFLVNSVYPSSTGTQKTLSLWSLTNPTTSPVLTRKSITTDPFSLPPDAAQKGGGMPLDTGDTRMLNAVFRGGSVWCALTTAHNWGSGNVASIHWFQINATSAALTQQGVFGASGFHYFYPAVMPDSNGNMTMVFSRSGSTEFASARYTGRKATDPAGQLQGSALLKAGVANYQGLDGSGRNRWGDYAGVGNDPADTLKTWIYTLYAAAGNQWATQIGATKF